VIEVMRGEGAPPTAVRAVVAGALCYLDAELLNALVLRRDCCSVSAVKALQAILVFTPQETTVANTRDSALTLNPKPFTVLSYLDAELLHPLVLRRDCGSVFTVE